MPRIELTAGERIEIAVEGLGAVAVQTSSGVASEWPQGIWYREPGGKTWHGPIPLAKLPAIAAVFQEPDAETAGTK